MFDEPEKNLNLEKLPFFEGFDLTQVTTSQIPRWKEASLLVHEGTANIESRDTTCACSEQKTKTWKKAPENGMFLHFFDAYLPDKSYRVT